MKKIICVFICIILLLFSMCGCSVLDGARMLKQDSEQAVYVTAAPRPKKVGETSEADMWKINLTAVEKVDSVGIAPMDTKAASGNKLLILYFDITNLSKDSRYFNYIYFTAYCDGTRVNMIAPATTLINEHIIAQGTVESDQTMKYFVLYEIPEATKKFRIEYNTGGVVPNILSLFEFQP